MQKISQERREVVGGGKEGEMGGRRGNEVGMII